MKAGLRQAEMDFAVACPLLELNEIIVAGERDPEKLQSLYTHLVSKWSVAPLRDKVLFANDSMTIQVSESCQAVADMDAGDTPQPAMPPRMRREEARASAAWSETPSIGPSSHTNPMPTLRMQMKHLHEVDKEGAEIRMRDMLTARHGFSLWLGPSQAATPDNAAGVYLKGKAAPGAVVALYPGAVYNSEMLQKPVDCGHLGNPKVPRTFVPRFDECVLDVHAASAPKHNPYALAHHVRHPPPGIVPNVMRLQFDFVANTDTATGILAFPAHLRDYIPNTWGSEVTLGQELFGMLEQNIWVKGMVLIALRPLWQEELFVDHALNPFSTKQPSWYRQLDEDASRRIWARLGQ